MKKLTLILAALALTLDLSQCKKQETLTTNESVHITLTANYGQGGAKTGFDPATGTFTWTGTTESPEYINVGGSINGYLGQLTSTQSGTTATFSGTIAPSDGEMLYFFYLGKGDHASATSVDFSNQDGTLANVTNYHIAISEGIAYEGQTSFSTMLNMAMAIAYFDVNGFKNASETDETVYLHGDEVYSTATINYKDGTISGDAKGYINFGTASNGKYVALIPSVDTETTLKFDSDSKTGAMTFLRGIQAGKYYADNNAALSVAAGALPEGATPGLFSVSATKMLRFSQGNLQYQASTNTWRFAEHQNDYVGQGDYGTVSVNGVKCNNGNISPTYTGWIDLFGWGTSGYDHGATCYQPYSTSKTESEYNPYGGTSYNLYDQTGKADWGYNKISNGGNTENSGWRTLTKDEWDHVLTKRTYANLKYGLGSVNGVHGMILLPDEWSLPAGLSFTSGYSSWANTYTTEQWAQMEANGAVFFPAAGCRTNGSSGLNDMNDRLYYWSSSYDGSNAYYRYIGVSFVWQMSGARHCGLSVRLVRDVE